MKGISSLSLPSARAFSVGDFFIGRISVRPLTPIGADGRRTARRGVLAGGGGLGIAREYLGSGGRILWPWRASVRLGFNSSGKGSWSGRGIPPKSGCCAGRTEYVCPGWTLPDGAVI
jgi:hypothetical protein